MIGYTDETQHEWVLSIEAEAQKSLNGYIEYIRRRQQGKKEFGSSIVREELAEYTLEPDVPTPDSLIPDSLIPNL